MLTAGEFCSREVVVAGYHDKVLEVARLMRDHHVGSVVVVEPRDGAKIPVGILTDRDIVVGLLAVEPSYLDRATVRDVVSQQLVLVREDEDLDNVMLRMRVHGVRRLPVVNRTGSLEGIIAFDDIIDHVAEELSRMASVLARGQHREREQRPPLSA